MSSSAEDTIGCAVLAAVAIGGSWWLYDSYQITKKQDLVAASMPIPAPEPRPAGLIPIATLENGTIWRLDADSISGPRTSRQIWVKADHANNKQTAARETASLYRLNCETMAYRTLKVIEYDKDGKVLNAWGPKFFGDDDDYAPPDSYIAAAAKAGCEPGYDIKQ